MSDTDRSAAVETWGAAIAAALAEREEQDLLRSLRPFRGVGPKVVSPEGRELLNLSSNDYLGLAGHPRLAEAAARAARERGTGATASRLVVGDDPFYQALEERLAEHKGTERALVLGSGFLANAGVIPALAGRGEAIFSDELNHASIVDGCRLAHGDVQRYRHRDADHLEQLLRSSRAKRKLIVSDTVFSMDGDTAPLRELVELKERYGAALLVDEAHASGVFGPHGEGYAHELGLARSIDLHMGTFSKAFGGYGAYLAGRDSWIRYLQNACRTLIYTTALPPPVIAAADAALTLVREAGEARRGLRRKAERVRARLAEFGLDTCGSTTQIVPILVGESSEAVDFGRALEERGALGVAIRPPSVPAGTARIRFSIMATHSDHDLERALDGVGSLATEKRS